MLEGVNSRPKRAFLIEYMQSGRKDKAAKAAGVSYSTVWGWNNRDESFRQAYETAQEVAVDLLEMEAVRRAKDGWLKPVFQAGTLVGHVREYDSSMLMFLLKGLKPERYVERREVYNVDVASRLRAGKERSINARLERTALKAGEPNASYKVMGMAAESPKGDTSHVPPTPPAQEKKRSPLGLMRRR